MPYEGSHIWRLRQKVGQDLLLMPASDCVIVRDDGALLLVWNKDFGVWAFPGGYAEPGQTSAECAAREALEEAGVEVDPQTLEPFAFVSGETVVYPGGDSTAPFIQVFMARQWRQTEEPVDTDEIAESRWFAPEDLLAGPMDEKERLVLEAYLEYLATGRYRCIALRRTLRRAAGEPPGEFGRAGDTGGLAGHAPV